MKILLISLIIGYISQPFAQGTALFHEPSQPVEDTEIYLNLKEDPSYVRHRFLNMNLNSVRSLSARDELETTQEESFIWDLELFPGTEFKVQVESIHPTQFGGSFIKAKIIEGGEGIYDFNAGERRCTIRGELHSSEGVIHYQQWKLQSKSSFNSGGKYSTSSFN